MDSADPGSQAAQDATLADVTRAVVRAWQCDCGTAGSDRVWVVVDARARPDLIADLRSGAFPKASCRLCARIRDHRIPLALARLATTVPLVLLRREDEDEDPGEDVLAGLEDAYQALVAEVGAFPRMAVPAEMLRTLLSRDIDADAAAIATGKPDEASAEGYWRFVADLPEIAGRERRHRLLTTLAGLHDRDEVLTFMRRTPEVVDDLALAVLKERAAAEPDRAAFFDIERRLLLSFRDRGTADVAARNREIGDFLRTYVNEPIDELRHAIQAAFDEHRWTDAGGAAERALELARDAGSEAEVIEFSYDAAVAYMHLGRSRPEMFERARALLEDVLATPQGTSNPSVALNLASIYGSRTAGDAGDNHERAIVLLDQVVAMSAKIDRELWAMAHTNLALAYHGRTSGDRGANLGLAVEHCRQALLVRSPEAGVDDWAYTMINLGIAGSDLAKLNRSQPLSAAKPYRSVLSHAGAIAERELVGLAHYNLGNAYLTAGMRSRWRRRRRLQRARALLGAALADFDGQAVMTARTRRLLADGAYAAGNVAEAADHLEAALAVLTPEMAPDECGVIATKAAWIAVDRDDWSTGAAHYRAAARALDLAYEGRATPERREAALREAVNLSRWAAFALARTGNAEAALEVLEGGKARAIATRTMQDEADLTVLADVSPTAATRYSAAVRTVRASEPGPALESAWRSLSEAVDAIRRIGGFEAFHHRSPRGDIEAAVASGWPLAFVNPTPWGTALLVAKPSDDGLQTSVRFLDITSTALVNVLIFGRDMATGSSYWAAITGASADALAGIESGLAFVGEAIARELGSLLEEGEPEGVTVIASGPLAMVPIHAAPWQEGGRSRCLADRRSVRYAPSAHLALAAIRRWREREGRSLVLTAVANPDAENPLPGSEAEVAELSALFPSESVHVRLGDEATIEFVADNAATATHLHFACHAYGDPADFRSSVIDLADGSLSIDDLLTKGELTAQVTVASACQTALVDLLEVAEEGYSLGAALLAAGSAAVVASCWPVDDYATALVMTRFYEELLADDARLPSEALERAQLWLRDLTEDEEQAYLGSHAALAAELRRRRGTSRQPGRRGDPDTAQSRPFASPFYWASFVALGV